MSLALNVCREGRRHGSREGHRRASTCRAWRSRRVGESVQLATLSRRADGRRTLVAGAAARTQSTVLGCEARHVWTVSAT